MPGTTKVIHALGCLLVFSGAWAAATWLSDRASGFPHVPELSEKRQRWMAVRDSIDTVFVGSSRTFHHIDPESYADAVAAEGLPRPRAYNAGANLMFPPESFRWLRELLATRPPKLKWVFLEFAGIRGKGEFGEGYEDSLRGVWWHDAQHTHIAIRHVWRDVHLSWLDKVGESADHISHAARVLSGAGRSGDQLTGLLLPRVAITEAGFNPETGFQGYDEVPMSADDTASYRKQLAARLAAPPPPVRPLPTDLRDALKDLIKEIHAAGAEIVLIEPPAGIPLSRPITPPPGALHLRYNAVEANAAWYAPETRKDGGHMIGSAAQTFSAQVGRDFATLIKKSSADTR